MKLSQKFNIKTLCKLFIVSESGYYKYKKWILESKNIQNNEKLDLKEIQEIALKYKRKYWYRMITMKLKKNEYILIIKKFSELCINMNYFQ